MIDTSRQHWLRAKAENKWEMPLASPWKCLPVIRHIRSTVAGFSVRRHNARWRSMGMLITGYDEWVVYGIWRGWEKNNHD